VVMKLSPQGGSNLGSGSVSCCASAINRHSLPKISNARHMPPRDHTNQFSNSRLVSRLHPSHFVAAPAMYLDGYLISDLIRCRETSALYGHCAGIPTRVR